MTILRRSKDRKTATSFTAGGAVRIANTFGLPEGPPSVGGSCNSATEACSACYVSALPYPSVRTVLDTNLAILQGMDVFDMTSAIDAMICDFVAECEKWGADPWFRIHWSGDFFSGEYTMAWIAVIHAHPEVRFWCYTRDARAYAYLMDEEFDNLTLWFSTDSTNVLESGTSQHERARVLASLYGDRFRPAYMADTFASAQEGNADLVGKPGAKCPEITGQIPLVGACARCRLCLDKPVKGIAFSVSGR